MESKTDVIPAKRRAAAREPGPTQTAGALFKIEPGFTVAPAPDQVRGCAAEFILGPRAARIRGPLGRE
jgi:hypothetical protein